MVDISDIGSINSLYGELNSISRIVELLDDGGRITSLTVGKKSAADPAFWEFTASVSTETMNYPAQMVDQIKTNLRNRESDILSELGNLGVTGGLGDARGGKQEAGR